MHSEAGVSSRDWGVAVFIENTQAHLPNIKFEIARCTCVNEMTF